MSVDAVITRDGPVAVPLDYQVPTGTEIIPRVISASFDGSAAAGSFLPTLEVLAPNGQVVGRFPVCAPIAAGGSAFVSWFPGIGICCCPAAALVPGVAVETLYLDSRTAGITSSTVLTAGKQYLVSVQGTYSLWNSALNNGTPESNALFPTSGGVGRVSTQVGLDADVKFAAFNQPGTYPQHTTEFQINVGSGYTHVEPEGGPFAVPQPGHLYYFLLTGQGSTASFRIFDSPQTDNYGYLRIVIQDPSGSGGGGTLLPGYGADKSILRTVGSTPTWVAQPAITEDDLALSDVTTDNVNTSRHGFAPKAPNDATKYLDGTGAYSTPPGAGTVNDVVSPGGTISVTNPTGPTVDLDLPASGVTAGTYGDGSHVPEITVDAEGRISAVTAVGISGGSGTIGFEIGYDQITAGVTVSSTTEASGTTIITCAAHTFDGSPVMCEFFSPSGALASIAGGMSMTISLFEGSTQIGRLLTYENPLNASGETDQTPLIGRLRFTPSAASHTYTVTGFKIGTGTASVGAGAGGTGTLVPCFVRFTKV